MKIMHVMLSLDYGGAEKVATNLINKMSQDRYDFSVCTLDRLGSASHGLNSNTRIECANRVSGLDLQLPFRMAKIIRKFSPDIVHAHNCTALLYGALAARLAGVKKIVVTQHGSIADESNKVKSVLKLYSGLISKNIAVSKTVETCIKNIYEPAGAKTELIINGIDEDYYSKIAGANNNLKADLGIKGNEFVIGHVARLSPEKDQTTLIRAFAKVLERSKAVKLIIVGDGPLRKSMETLSTELGIADKVIFAGFQDNIRSFLNIFDIFVLPSIREGTSLTLLEAMAMELPVIATDVGGNPDIVINNETGLLVPSKDIDALSGAILKLHNYSLLRNKMGKAGRARVDRNFSLRAMTEKYDTIYRALMRNS